MDGGLRRTTDKRVAVWLTDMRGVLLAAVFTLASSCTSAQKNPWPELKSPYGDPAQARAIGGYSAGCLVGGVSLTPDGRGYQLMRLTRRRFYGHPELLAFITELADEVARARLGSLLVGDLGQPRGGPTHSNHRSHQSGLDVDVWYLRQLEPRSLTLDERENLSALNFVAPDGASVEPRFGEAEAKILKAAATNPRVERIFVHAAIKRHLCQTQKDRAWLRRIRPWYGHDHHFHVRLKCPAGSAECQIQESIPDGDGCDSSLEWWFSDEARAKGAETAGIPPVPKLPAECEPVLAAP